MSLCLENFGLDCFMENEENFQSFCNFVAATASPMKGYYNIPYLNKHLGWAQIIMTLSPGEENNEQLVLEGVDTHLSGICTWKVCVSPIDSFGKGLCKLRKRIAVTRPDGSGFAVVNVVNSDVLPSYAPGREIGLQMAMFPEDVRYYADEDAYVKERNEEDDMPLADGCIMPIGFLTNGTNGVKGIEWNEDIEDMTLVRGTVKKIFRGPIVLEEGSDPIFEFVDVVIDTHFGELELVHTFDAVDSKYQNNIRKGAIVSCVGVLSGDPAVELYKDGMVQDEENNLLILADVLCGGDTERLRTVLLDDVHFYSESSKKELHTADELIEWQKYVQANSSNLSFDLATITQAEDDARYPGGTRCIELTYENLNNQSILVFVENTEDWYIKKIYITDGREYKYVCDRLPGVPSDEEIEICIQVLMSEYCEDDEALTEYLEEQADNYSGDIADFAFRVAIRLGKTAYIEEHAEEFDLNDEGGYSSYLYETDDEEIQELLMDLGAFRSLEDYTDYKLAIETVNGTILAFNQDFQREVFQKYLETFGLTEEDVLRMFNNPEEIEAFNDEQGRYFIDEMESMGIAFLNGAIEYKDMTDEDGFSLQELVEELGWDFNFEGERWKFETLGVYYIE